MVTKYACQAYTGFDNPYWYNLWPPPPPRHITWIALKAAKSKFTHPYLFIYWYMSLFNFVFIYLSNCEYIFLYVDVHIPISLFYLRAYIFATKFLLYMFSVLLHKFKRISHLSHLYVCKRSCDYIFSLIRKTLLPRIVIHTSPLNAWCLTII